MNPTDVLFQAGNLVTSFINSFIQSGVLKDTQRAAGAAQDRLEMYQENLLRQQYEAEQDVAAFTRKEMTKVAAVVVVLLMVTVIVYYVWKK